MFYFCNVTLIEKLSMCASLLFSGKDLTGTTDLLALGKGIDRECKMEAFLNTVSGCELQNYCCSGQLSCN